MVKGHDQHQPNEPATWLQQLITNTSGYYCLYPRFIYTSITFWQDYNQMGALVV